MRSIPIVLYLLGATAVTLRAQDAVVPQIATSSVTKPKLELRIVPGQLDRGLPKSFTFVFVNESDRQLRMPRPTQCTGGNGTVLLRSQFRPVNTRAVPSGGAGGCGRGGGKIHVLEWAKSWQELDPGKSLSVSYSRQDLFNFQEDAGDYEFWGEYVPPKLTIEDVSLLERAGVQFPRVLLASAHLHFRRPQ